MYFAIHACPERMWYVNGYLVPSMTAQGIKKEDIVVVCDNKGLGNVESCMQIFKKIRKLLPKSEAVWHLQDDVIISDKFVRLAREYDRKGVVNGFANVYFEGDRAKYTGKRPAYHTWYSFQCIHIPNDLAEECADWFYGEGQETELVQECIATQRGDDGIWRLFLSMKHPDLSVINLTPNMVDHIDYLIGGSTISTERRAERRALYWENEGLVIALKERLIADGKLEEVDCGSQEG